MRFSRRRFLGQAVAAGGAAWLAQRAACAERLGFPLVDYHVHLDNSTIDKVCELGRERGVKFGIVEHAGTKENKYPTVLSNDAELERYLAMLAGKGVYCGVQAEWLDWSSGFSQKALARLDHVLMDAMTFPGRDGQRVKLWEPDVESRVEMADKQAFMERFVDWHVQIIVEQPVDILANLTWLPKPLADQYDAYWTPARMQRVIDAAVKHGVALEISASYKVPSLAFLRLAKAAGAKFSFGSNGRYPKMGLLDHSVEMAQTLGLTAADMFTPATGRRKTHGLPGRARIG